MRARSVGGQCGVVCLYIVQNISRSVKTWGCPDKKFASRVAGRQDELRDCPGVRTGRELWAAHTARLSDWSPQQLIQTAAHSNSELTLEMACWHLVVSDKHPCPHLASLAHISPDRRRLSG